MPKRIINEMKIVPCTQYRENKQPLYSLYINGELELHASAEYMADIVKEYLLNSHNEKVDDYNPAPYEKGTTDLIEKGWKVKGLWEDEE